MRNFATVNRPRFIGDVTVVDVVRSWIDRLSQEENRHTSRARGAYRRLDVPEDEYLAFVELLSDSLQEAYDAGIVEGSVSEPTVEQARATDALLAMMLLLDRRAATKPTKKELKEKP